MVLQSFPARLLALSALASVAAAQETINTDRPGLTFTPWLVPPGRLQVELGIPNVALEQSRGADVTSWNTPLQLRYGLTSALELRLGSPLYNVARDDVADTTTEGWGDVEVGAKVALCEASGWLPKTALFGGVRLPVGDDDFTSSQAGYNLNLAADWYPGEGNTVRALAGVTRTPVGSDDALQASFAGLYGRALGAKTGAYVELGYLPGFHLADDQGFAGAGLTYLLNNDLQLDVSGDFGLNDESADAIVGLGLSWRG